MVKFGVICCFVLTLIACIEALSNECPSSSKMTSCSPICKTDIDCHGLKCCPNICNQKSCAPANLASNTNTGYKGSTSGATGVYCGNVKCSSYEKCEMDRSTKRPKCTRT